MCPNPSIFHVFLDSNEKIKRELGWLSQHTQCNSSPILKGERKKKASPSYYSDLSTFHLMNTDPDILGLNCELQLFLVLYKKYMYISIIWHEILTQDCELFSV